MKLTHSLAAAALLGLASWGLATPPPAIAVVPRNGDSVRVDAPVPLNGTEFELLVLEHHDGPVVWDVTTPGGGPVPVAYYPLKPEVVVIGVRAGTKNPAVYLAPATPSVAIFPAGKGRAVVAAWGVVDGRPVKLATRLIDANGVPNPEPPGPNPNPEPDPEPAPEPGPKAAKLAVVVIEETLQRTPAQGKALFDKTLRGWLDAGGHGMDLVDKDDKKVGESGYGPYVTRVGLPTVLVFDAEKSGQQIPLKTFKLSPAVTGDEILKSLKETVK